MIKIWTWRPLEMGVSYCKSIDSAVELIDSKITSLEDGLNQSLRAHNAQIEKQNEHIPQEALKQKLRTEMEFTLDEILDMFTVFDLDLNKFFLAHYRSRHAKSKSDHKKDETQR